MKPQKPTYRQELNKLAQQKGYKLLNFTGYILVNEKTNEILLIEKLFHAEIELKRLPKK